MREIQTDSAIKDPIFKDFLQNCQFDYLNSPRQEIVNKDLPNSTITEEKVSKDKILDPKDISIEVGKGTSTITDDSKKELNTSVASEQKDVLAEDMFKKRKKWGHRIQTYSLVNGVFKPKDMEDDAKKEKEIEKQRLKKL